MSTRPESTLSSVCCVIAGRPGMMALYCLLVMAMAGCTGGRPSLLAKKQPGDFYELSRVEVATDGLPAVAAPIAVTEPHATGALATSLIEVQVGDNRLEALAGARWAGSIPRQLHWLLLEAFESTARASQVERDPTLIRTGYHLRSELRDARAVIVDGAGPSIRVRLAGKLHRVPSEDLVAVTFFDGQATAASDEPAAIVAAFDEAISAVVRELVAWTLQQAAEDSAGQLGRS